MSEATPARPDPAGLLKGARRWALSATVVGTSIVVRYTAPHTTAGEVTQHAHAGLVICLAIQLVAQGVTEACRRLPVRASFTMEFGKDKRQESKSGES